jgi:hypothetical protein
MDNPFQPFEIIIIAQTLSFYPMFINCCDNSKLKSTAVVIGTTSLPTKTDLSPSIEKLTTKYRHCDMLIAGPKIKSTVDVIGAPPIHSTAIVMGQVL